MVNSIVKKEPQKRKPKNKKSRQVRQKQKQQQTVNVKVNLGSTSNNPKSLQPPNYTFYTQPAGQIESASFTETNRLLNNILQENKMRNNQRNTLNNISGLSNIVEQNINKQLWDDPETNGPNYSSQFDNLLFQKLPSTKLGITELNKEEKSDNALSDLVYTSKKSQAGRPEDVVNNAENLQLFEEQNNNLGENEGDKIYIKSVSKMGKDELITKYYDLVNDLNITDNFNPLEIGSLTVPKIRDAVNQLVEKQKNKNKNDELIEKLNYKLLIQQEKLKAVPMANVSERIKKTKIDQHNKNIVNLQQQITELLKK